MINLIDPVTLTPTDAPAEAPPTAEPTEAAAEPLPAAPQTIMFAAADGQVLEGTYYPAGRYPAPVVVLMHWAPGDASHWAEVAYWLQNRGQGGTEPSSDPWRDPSWFPEMPDGASYAVFTFTFRGCGGGNGCQSFDPDGWRQDALAAMRTAQDLEGVDPGQAVAIGASIGSDGAADACGDGCLGAMSLSPGSYLGVPFKDAVAAVDGADPPRPVWCLAAEGDGDSASTCESASGALYRSIIYEGNDHGMMLLRPGTDPNALELILEFLAMTLGHVSN